MTPFTAPSTCNQLPCNKTTYPPVGTSPSNKKGGPMTEAERGEGVGGIFNS